MAHFAQLDENNEVINIIVVNNDVLLDNEKENESLGIAFCQSLFGENTQWVQTSYNGTFRKVYAGRNMVYDKTNDRFMPKKPFDSWSFNEETYKWEPPIPMPETDGVQYEWNELTQNWNEIIIAFSSDPNITATADIPELMPVENVIINE